MFRIGIVAHNARAHTAKQLAHQVSADFISFDTGVLGCDGNHDAVHRHLLALPSTWSVILEDDAQPVPGFRHQLDQALPMSPSPIVSFYMGRKKPQHWQHRYRKALAHADTANASWIQSTHLLHAVGYAIKTELLPSLLDHTSTLPIDQHIGHWARHYGHTVAYTHPSLVDHADTPTLVNHPDGQPRTPGRKAHHLGERQQWTTTTVPLR